MKSAAPFIALGSGVIAIVAGIFFFGDQLGLGDKGKAPEKPVATLTDSGSSEASKPQNTKTSGSSSDVSEKPSNEVAKTAEKAVAKSESEETTTAGKEADANMAITSDEKKEASSETSEEQKTVASEDASESDAKSDLDKNQLADTKEETNTQTNQQSGDKTADAKPADGGDAIDTDDAIDEVAPSFDVVRVEPDGQTLVAGKAAPGWIVELRNGDATISKAIADQNGDWVMILEEALSQGVSDLSLAAKAEEGATALSSSSNVTVALPENGKGELLVVESVPGQASKILAKIAAKGKEVAAPVAKKAMEVADAAEKTGAEAKTMAENASDVAKVAEEKIAKAAEAVAAVAAVSDADENAKKDQMAADGDKISPESSDTSEAAGVAQSADGKDKVAKDASSEGTDTNTEAKTETATNEAKQEEKPVAKAPKAEPVVERLISIEAVEIEGDTLFVAGAAEPAGSIVRLYVDNKAISDSRSGETGRFLFDGKISLEPGTHQARVDLLDTRGGKVATRAEVKFSKKAPNAAKARVESALVSPVASTTAGAEEKTAEGSEAETSSSASSSAANPAQEGIKQKKVIIRRGDNLWEIARRVYGAGIRYSTIYDSNTQQIRDPHWIYPGQVFELPDGEEGWEHNFEAVDAPSAEEQAAAAEDEAQ